MDKQERGGQVDGPSETRLGDLLQIGQFFEACGNIFGPNLRQLFEKLSKSFNCLGTYHRKLPWRFSGNFLLKYSGHTDRHKQETDR